MYKRISIVLISSVLIALPWLLPPYPMQLMVFVGVFAILTLSLNLIVGYVGMISLGHAGFFLVGAYTSALLTTDFGISFWLTLPIAITLTALFGLGVGFPALKLSGHFLAVITIAFGLIMHILSVNLEWLTNGISGISNIPRPTFFSYVLRSDAQYYYLVLALLALLVMVFNQLIESGFGRALKAVREDETGAACMGVNVNRVKVASFVLSAAIAGLAGALYAHYVRYLNPDSFTIDISIRVFIMMIIGGIGSIAGSLIGAFAVYTLPEALRFLNEYYYLVFGALVVAMMLFLPGGLVSINAIIQRKTQLHPGVLSVFSLKSGKKEDRRGRHT